MNTKLAKLGLSEKIVLFPPHREMLIYIFLNKILVSGLGCFQGPALVVSSIGQTLMS